MKGFRKKLEAPFARAARWILKIIPEQGLRRNKEKLDMDLKALGWSEGGTAVREYYVQKLTLLLMIAFWGIGLLLLYHSMETKDNNQIKKESVARPDYGEEERETELELYIGEQVFEIPVQVSPRKMTENQLQNFFQKAVSQLEKILPGTNTSLDEVRFDLNLRKVLELDEGNVLVEWYTEPEDLLDETGKILRSPPENGEPLQLRAIIKYQDQELEHVFPARIFPRGNTEEVIRESAKAELQKIDESTRYDAKLKLPDKLGTENIRWEEKQESSTVLLGILLFVILSAVSIGKDREVGRAAAIRRQQLLIEYPAMVFKLTMLLGAGLTMRTAFEKTAEEVKGNGTDKKKYVYDEMQMTCREMKSGIAEATAYENFGKRCQESVYIKLGAILAQNLKKGSKGLTGVLEKEAHMSLEDRKAMVKKMGEEAGTKLLFPMLLMLIIVLVILMVPAAMSF